MSLEYYPGYNRFFLAESDDHIVYHEYEYVFLKNKNKTKDIIIDSHHNEPSGAIILNDGQSKDSFVIISGYGLSIYNLKTKKLVKFWNEPHNLKQPEGLYIPFGSNDNEFGFVMRYDSKQLRVFMGNAETLIFKEQK